MTSIRLVVLAFSLLLATLATSQDIRTKEVKFKAGQGSITLKGNVKGDQTVDYLLRAKAGQWMTVALKSRHTACCFNVTAPGQDTALFIGSTSGPLYEGLLPADGDYTVRLYLMRSAARRGEKASYTITFAIDGDAAGPASTTLSKNPTAK